MGKLFRYKNFFMLKIINALFKTTGLGFKWLIRPVKC